MIGLSKFHFHSSLFEFFINHFSFCEVKDTRRQIKSEKKKEEPEANRFAKFSPWEQVEKEEEEEETRWNFIFPVPLPRIHPGSDIYQTYVSIIWGNRWIIYSRRALSSAFSKACVEDGAGWGIIDSGYMNIVIDDIIPGWHSFLLLIATSRNTR